MKEIYINKFLVSNIELGIDNIEKKYSEGNYIYFSPKNYSFIKIKKNNNYCIEFLTESFCIYEYKNNEVHLFTNDFSLIEVLKLDLSLNMKGIKELILFNTPLLKNTVFNEVVYHSNVSKILIKKNIEFVELSDKQTTSLSVIKFLDDKIKEFKNIFLNRSHSLLLSGGYESRINVSIAKKLGLNFKTYTWGHKKAVDNKIAEKITKVINVSHNLIPQDNSKFNYQEFLSLSGYNVSLQYVFRLTMIKQLGKISDENIIWTGWGDVNGYTHHDKQNEYFTKFLLEYLYNNNKIKPYGWNETLLSTYDLSFLDNLRSKYGGKESISVFKHEFLYNRIWNSVINAEQLIKPIFSIWHFREYYSLMGKIIVSDEKLTSNRKYRVVWKHHLYYNIIKKYMKELNYLKVAKGWYPFLFRSNNSVLLLIAYILNKLQKKDKFYKPLEDKVFLFEELKKIVENCNEDFFDKKELQSLLSKHETWDGVDFFNIYKFIQVDWLIKKYEVSKAK